jgi:hypothetical protein
MLAPVHFSAPQMQRLRAVHAEFCQLMPSQPDLALWTTASLQIFKECCPDVDLPANVEPFVTWIEKIIHARRSRYVIN